MIIICAIQTYKLPALEFAIAQYNEQAPAYPWGFVVLERDSKAGISFVRIVLMCDRLPPPELEIPIEAVFESPQYCLECLKEGKWTKLGTKKPNTSGYCYKHRDKDPKRTQRKRK